MTIEKLRPSFTFTEDRLRELQAVVPEAFADGKINWDVLREALGEHLEDETQEHFGLSWPGKRDARRLAAMPSKGTLVPMPGEGVNEDETHNIFIEGENLEVLKILRKSYSGRIKVIYIDPPYNLNKDFIYEDCSIEPLKLYLQRRGEINDEGIVLTTNTKSSGRFHSIWLSSIMPRLIIARSLLTDDGIIFISIDDREVHHLRIILNEIFGDENFLATFVWVNEGNIDNQSKVKTNHEYIISYAKDLDKFLAPSVIDPNIPLSSKLYKDEIENTIIKNGPKNPISGVVLPKGFPANFEEGAIEPIENSWPKINKKIFVKNYEIQNEVIVTSGWSSKIIFEKFIKSGFKPVFDTKGQKTKFFITKNGAIYTKKDRPDTQSHVLSVLKGMGTVQAAASALLKIGIFFDYPKPTELINYLLQVGNSEDSIVLDFYAGTCPLAQATYELNRLDEGNRKFICVQIPEVTSQNSLARKAGFKNISEIGKARIRSVVEEYSKFGKDKLLYDTKEDLGFKVFSLENSNFREWDLNKTNELKILGTLFDNFESPLIEGWKHEGLLNEILLLEGFPLDSRINDLTSFSNNLIQSVYSDFCEHGLLVCLDEKIEEATIQQLSLRDNDIFICLDTALSDEGKIQISDRCNLKVI